MAAHPTTAVSLTKKVKWPSFGREGNGESLGQLGGASLSAIWHPGAALYNKAKTLLGDHRLEVRALFLPDDEIVAAETGGLIGYRRTYGELPPFN